MGFKIKDRVLENYSGSTSDVIIPSDVTKIGASAFEGNKYLTSVIITGNVKIIDSKAFSNCLCLERVIIPDGVTEIRYDAFRGCINLSEIIIPESVTKIGENAFSGTKWLENKKATEKDVVIINGIVVAKSYDMGESVNLEGVKEIPMDFFMKCRQIKEFIISDGVKIGNNALFTGNNFSICLKSDAMYVNIPVKDYIIVKSGYCTFDTTAQSLLEFIGADMKGKEIIFDDLEIPEYRYPLAVFMAVSYESEFFRTFIDVHFKKIQEYAKNKAPYLLEFIGR